jgi:membrane fusion protein (multidrug efflux system)
MYPKLIFILLSLFFLFSCGENEDGKKEIVVPVQIFSLKPDSISSFLELTANLEAINEAQVYSKIQEEVIAIPKNVGSRVNKGEVIVELDSRLLLQNLKQAEASLQSVEANYNQIKQEYERYQRLYKENAVSQQQYDMMNASMLSSEGALAQAKAVCQQAKENYENAFIKAPFNGVVGNIYFFEGQMVTMGKPVVKIVNTNLMKALLDVPDIHINKIQLEQNVIARFPMIENRIFKGIIDKIDPAIDPLSRTIQVEVIFENKTKELKSGMYGLFKIELEKHRDTFIVPDNAIIRQTEVRINPETGETYTHRRCYVYKVDADSARLIRVRLGIEESNRIELTDGVALNDSIIVVGQKLVKDGQKVRVIISD